MGASTWESNPAAAVDNSWKIGGDDGFPTDGWAAHSMTDGAFTGDFSAANISKHADGNFHDGAADGGCRICHEDGHFARDCPNKPAGSGGCFNCGQEGHQKAECPNPAVEREFTGTCHVCEQPGHRAAECPQKPPAICKLCKGEGHISSECTVNRMHSMFVTMNIQECDINSAWTAVEVADTQKDLEDIKRAILTYAKAFPSLTFEELEQTFREAQMNTHLIAKEQKVSDTHTIVNLQGEVDQKFVVSFQFSAKPRRAKFAEGWPSSPEENIHRLAEAGFVMDSLVMKCSNCGELGHGSKKCEQEKSEPAKIIITCAVCNETGHRARDCTAERKKPGTKGCRNCGSDGHIAKECSEPPNMDNVECKNCGEMGHFGRDCPSKAPEICHNCKQEGHRSKDCTNERVMQCRNCDGVGHISRECPLPTDWSRVECTNCKQKGHSYKRCKQPPAEEPTGGDGGFEGNAGSVGAPSGDAWDTGAAASSSGGGWESNNAPAGNWSGGW